MNGKMNSAALSLLAGACMAAATVPQTASASSHREAPFVTEHPKVDGTDLYVFNSYETGRAGFVTILANYQPLQDAYGGPNYFLMDPEARYDINIDNDGDSLPDQIYRFKFTNVLKDQQIPVGGVNVSIPLPQSGQVITDTSKLNVLEFYTVQKITQTNTRRRSTQRVASVINRDTGSPVFVKPFDNIGNKTFPNYDSYANAHVFPITVPDCAAPGARAFVGQRKDPFPLNLGEIFDLINLNPVGDPSAKKNTIADKNVTVLALEIPASCLTKAPNTTIGVWTTASLPTQSTLLSKPTFNRPTRDSSTYTQVSRLANPLVNEVVIGLKDKDKFNNSAPKDDAQFATYVTNPTLPSLIQLLFPVTTAPPSPRNDLLQVFVTGVPGLNQFGFGEYMRLNTAIPAVAKGSQNNLGVIGGDTAGYPNGRRPGDDSVDISLRVVMGKLLPTSVAPSGQLPLTDGTPNSDANFLGVFPYETTPNPGSPQL